MAEDQGVNGTIWNKEANYILSWFGWETIGAMMSRSME